MYVLRMPKAKCFLVVPDEQTKALFLDRIKKISQVLEAGVCDVVKPGEVLLINGLEIKPLVLDINTLSEVSHSDPECSAVCANSLDSGTK